MCVREKHRSGTTYAQGPEGLLADCERLETVGETMIVLARLAALNNPILTRFYFLQSTTCTQC